MERGSRVDVEETDTCGVSTETHLVTQEQQLKEQRAGSVQVPPQQRLQG